ncbi:type II toxin-antitoxin system PemK/MazF family toxin [Candidatus Micrarchaeota archaeon]|nr:type II toxin-antitoxin system PemK/MazF family toxin [Candidatus Micrarchaeota archaeon]
MVIVELSFPSISGSKLRPALIINSQNLSSRDVILLKITSHYKNTEKNLFVPVCIDDTENRSLLKDSYVQTDFILTLDSILINKKIDKIKDEKLEEVKNKLKIIFNL